MTRLLSVRTPREGGPRGIRASLLVLALALVIAVGAPVSDVGLYHVYAAGFPHHLPLEYPALAGVVFAAPRLLPLPYTAGFMLLMAAAFLLILGVGRRVRTADRSGAEDGSWNERFVCYVAFGVVGVLLTRFDLLPALTVLLAVERARAGRYRSAWIWALVGALLKVFPILLLPGFLLAERRATKRVPWARMACSGGALGAVAAVQSWAAPGSLPRPLSYELHRGFEFSSVPGTLTLLLSPTHLRFVFAFGNHQVYGTGHSAIGVLMLLVAGAALLGTWVLAARGSMPVEAVALAVVSIAVLTDKALAPQYLLWLAPLWAYWRMRPSWLLASALTTLVFPVLFLAAWHTRSLYPDAVVSAVRNAVLLGGTVAWAAEGLRTRWAERATCPAVASNDVGSGPVPSGITVPDAMEVVPCPVSA